ncbi:histidine phosphatase family protein [Acinetobacter sp. WZC-1]|uniref:histidine phosphatase family protein n=1 Tax=Acinetobacter sp. WZC-1 TaxID=3459034 RepID=UPI00403DA079
MTLERLPQSMLSALDLLPDVSVPVTLFTRHSIREVVEGRGLVSADLPLTEQGRELALAWGEYLTTYTDRVIQQCISSPIQRCVDTAALMIQGADRISAAGHLHQIEIVRQGLLVEPGSFVVDATQARPYLRQQGAVGFINSFMQNALPGMKHPIRGVIDVLQLIYDRHPQQHRGLSLAVSHDTILAAILSLISGRRELSQDDWPQMMEGFFVWFEGEDSFMESRLKWIWRGEVHTLLIREFQQLQVG